MKLKSIILTITVYAGVAALASGNEQRMLLVLPSHLDKEGGAKIAQTVYEIVERAPVRTRLTFIEAGGQPRHLFDFTKSDYANRRQERDAKRKFQTSLNGFFAYTAKAGAKKESIGSLNTPALAIFIPAWIEDATNTRVLFCGSVCYTADPKRGFVDPKQKDLKLRYRRPSYGHLTDAKRFQSPFAMPENAPDLSELVIQWFDPYQQPFPQSDHFYNEVAEFHAALFDRYDARLAKVRTDSATFVAEVFGKPDSFVPVKIRDGEKTIEMLTLSDLEEKVRREEEEKARIEAESLAKQEADRLEVIAAAKKAEADAKAEAKKNRLHEIHLADLRRKQELEDKDAILIAKQRANMQAQKKAEYEAKMENPVALPPLKRIFCVDGSQSVKPFWDKIGRELSGHTVRDNERMALVLFTDYEREDMTKPISQFFSESSDASDLVNAFRAIAPQGCGGTASEALNEGLATVVETLADRKQDTKAEIFIITDAVPLAVGEHPANRPGYLELIAKLLAGGNSVTIYSCGNLDTSWVPNGCLIRDL